MMHICHAERSAVHSSRINAKCVRTNESTVCLGKTGHHAFFWARSSALPAVSVNVPGSLAATTYWQLTPEPPRLLTGLGPELHLFQQSYQV